MSASQSPNPCYISAHRLQLAFPAGLEGIVATVIQDPSEGDGSGPSTSTTAGVSETSVPAQSRRAEIDSVFGWFAHEDIS
jgi:hypothetical protein